MAILVAVLKVLLELTAECLLKISEWLVILANIILRLDYLYIEWIIDLISPFFSFIIFLFCLPLVFVAISFGAAFYIFLQKLKKHRANLMVRKHNSQLDIWLCCIFFYFASQTLKYL